MKVANIQSFYLAPDVIGYIIYQSEKLKMSRSAIVEMMVRYIASQDQEYIGAGYDENTTSNLDNFIQHPELFEDDFGFYG